MAGTGASTSRQGSPSQSCDQTVMRAAISSWHASFEAGGPVDCAPMAHGSYPHGFSAFGRALLLLLAFCLFANSVRASVCAIHDSTPASQNSVIEGASVEAPQISVDDCCPSCFGCRQGGNCCSTAAALAHAQVLGAPVHEVISKLQWLSALDVQQRPSEPLRPPIRI